MKKYPQLKRNQTGLYLGSGHFYNPFVFPAVVLVQKLKLGIQVSAVPLALTCSHSIGLCKKTEDKAKGNKKCFKRDKAIKKET